MSAYWIKCDIDGAGRMWRLAVEREGSVYFVEEDFAEEMTLDEYREEFPNNSIAPVAPPPDDGGFA